MRKSNGEIVSDDDNNESTESEEEVVENQSKVVQTYLPYCSVKIDHFGQVIKGRFLDSRWLDKGRYSS